MGNGREALPGRPVKSHQQGKAEGNAATLGELALNIGTRSNDPGDLAGKGLAAEGQ